jgi:hypothetical protein
MGSERQAATQLKYLVLSLLLFVIVAVTKPRS